MSVATKAKQETWREMLARGGIDPEAIDRLQTLTRDEVLDRLRDGGVEVSAYDLQNWQQAGIIPHGVRKRHEGATRLMYPWWMVDIIRTLRELQRSESVPLSRLPQLLTLQALQLTKHRDQSPKPTPPPEIEPILRRWAERHHDTYGITVRHVDVSLIDERGHPLTFRFDIPE